MQPAGHKALVCTEMGKERVQDELHSRAQGGVCSPSMEIWRCFISASILGLGFSPCALLSFFTSTCRIDKGD